jgi:hypothetical protein
MIEKKVTVLLPTYNEANNIPPLLRALHDELEPVCMIVLILPQQLLDVCRKRTHRYD